MRIMLIMRVLHSFLVRQNWQLTKLPSFMDEKSPTFATANKQLNNNNS